MSLMRSLLRPPPSNKSAPGMSISPTPNPLKHVFNAIGEDVEWLTYGKESI